MKNVLLMVLMVGGIFTAQAQEEEPYTEEELTKYATVMVWAEQETENLRNLVRDSVELWLSEEVLSNAKYNDLSAAQRKGTISEVEATAEELAVFEEIQKRIEDKKTAFTEKYKARILDEIGGRLYNRLNKDLKSDTEVQERYEQIYSRMMEEVDTPEETASDTTAIDTGK